MECEHGSEECIANYMQACIFQRTFEMLRFSLSNGFDFLTMLEPLKMNFAYCMESEIGNETTPALDIADNCVKEVFENLPNVQMGMILSCKAEMWIDVST